MSRSRSRVNVAFVEDCDYSDDSAPEGNARSRVYAMSEPPDSPSPPPAKEIPNTSKSRSDKYRSSARRGTSSASSSDSTGHSSRKGRSEKRESHTRESRKKEAERQEELRKRDKKDERRQKAIERAQRESTKALKKVRPSGPKHSATQPIMSPPDHRPNYDDPSTYGHPPYGPPAGSRPRASTRPASYYSGQSARPPPSATGFPPGHGIPPPPSPFSVGTFPPPQMYPMMPPPSSVHSGPPTRSPGGMSAYFDNGPPPALHGRDLRSRFETRPSSALGFSPSQRSYLQEQFGYDDEPTHRPPTRTSRTKKHEVEDDRKRMPPPDYVPMRPRTTANSSTPFHPPPPGRPASRHGRTASRSKPCRRAPGYGGYEDDDFLGDDGLYQDIMPDNGSYDSRRMALARPQRRDSMYEDDDEEYDVGPMSMNNRMTRRGSVYNSHALGTGGVSLEDNNKYISALRYQDDVAGVSPMPLTAESLRKANRRGEVASSRSTRSSGSHDDSDYKRSNTTGFTQSSNGEDFTIKVSGAAVVRLGNAEIECEDSEITFSNGMPRFGGDQASTIYQLEDSRSRVERKALPHRPRAPSHSEARNRGYAPSHAPYESPFPSFY